MSNRLFELCFKLFLFDLFDQFFINDWRLIFHSFEHLFLFIYKFSLLKHWLTVLKTLLFLLKYSEVLMHFSLIVNKHLWKTLIKSFISLQVWNNFSNFDFWYFQTFIITSSSVFQIQFRSQILKVFLTHKLILQDPSTLITRLIDPSFTFHLTYHL